ncbi:MAG: hypothetical protein JW860_12170 [Sedimentisphaerales bacterium]|nr:hypothetical protein [Sedimentisphaerales bacterium]
MIEALTGNDTGKLANAPDDQTHFNEKGAREMARLVMQQLPEVEPSLKLKQCLIKLR